MSLPRLKTVGETSVIACILGIALATNILAGQTPGDPPQLRGQKKVQSVPVAPVPTEPNEDGPGDLKRQMMELESTIQRMIAENQLQMERMAQKLKAPPPPAAVKTELRIFSLKNLEADEVAATIASLFDHAALNQAGPDPGANGAFMGGAGALGLGGMFGMTGGQGGAGIQGGAGMLGMLGAGPPPTPVRPRAAGSPPYKLRLATMERTNALIVRGNADDLAMIEALITKLETLPVRRDKEK